MIIAQKPCSFGGISYYAGDRIPEADVINVEALQKMGVISVMADSSIDQVCFRVPIKKDGKTMQLAVTNEQMSKAMETIQTPQKEALSEIKESIDDDTVLILINALDARAAVKKETEAKAARIHPAESAGD